MSSSQQHDAKEVLVLWSLDSDDVTRALRLTPRKLGAAGLALGALLALCAWLGWELGHWSAKADAPQTAFSAPEVGVEG